MFCVCEHVFVVCGCLWCVGGWVKICTLHTGPRRNPQFWTSLDAALPGGWGLIVASARRKGKECTK